MKYLKDAEAYLPIFKVEGRYGYSTRVLTPKKDRRTITELAELATHIHVSTLEYCKARRAYYEDEENAVAKRREDIAEDVYRILKS